MKKSLISGICAAVVCAAVLGGCGKSDENSISDIMNETGLPIAKKEVTLEVGVQKAPHVVNFKDMPMLQELEKKTNVKIKWREYASESYWEKINLMIASKNFPDIMWCLLSDPQITELADNGVIYQLDDYIDKYSPRWKEVFEEYPYAKRASTAPDGHIYSLPCIRREEAYNGFRDATFINKDWLDKLGLSVPKTTDELETVLKAFATMDPNGNGDNDELPWSFVYGNNISGELDIYGSFGLIDVPDKMVMRNGKVLYSVLQPENRTAVKYMRKLYEDGVIDPESFVQNTTQLNAKIQAQPSIVGMYSGYGPIHDPEYANYVAIPPFISDPAVKPVARSQVNSVMKGYFTVFKNNKYPEISMRWANELAKADFGVEALYGPLEKRADGTYMTLEKDDSTALSKFPGTYGPFVITDEELNKIVGNESKQTRMDLYEIYKPYAVSEKDMFPPVWYTKEQREVLTSYRTEINEYAKTKRADWITKGNMDAEWDEFCAKLESMGLQKVIDVYQAAYDSFYAN